ncbi:hypothetical protein DRB96_41880 [Streptomyces sp. ICC1]|nr:hypothetical protein DRB89_33205 [Streptomyces sp. ICC4]AWZ17546.1 hypothetical protein DRB96_41880 [Streptomyces sp. ICC1]
MIMGHASTAVLRPAAASAEPLPVFRNNCAGGLPVVRRTPVGRPVERSRTRAHPLYARLAEEWTARGATVPCRLDPLWQRLVSAEHFRRETERTLRQLYLAGDAHPDDGAAASVRGEVLA